MSIPYPHIDPVLVSIGPIVIRWYALAYIVGILGGFGIIWKYTATLKPPIFTPKALEDLILWLTLGIVLGGRLGYIFFYQPGYYLENPSHILRLWEGGMSYHGGMIGVILALYLLCAREKINFLAASDLVVCVAPIGLFLGRLANFINGELYGRETDVPWGMIFPNAGSIIRHPSQLYEALLEGLVLFILLNYMMIKSSWRHTPGAIGGLYLIGYGLSRFTVEYFREPDEQLGFFASYFTMGQLLCVPMVLIGIGLILYARYRSSLKPSPHA